MGVCGQNICDHVAEFVILFNFDMQHDHVRQMLNFDLLTLNPGSVSWGWLGVYEKIFATMLLHS